VDRLDSKLPDSLATGFLAHEIDRANKECPNAKARAGSGPPAVKSHFAFGVILCGKRIDPQLPIRK